MSIGSSSGAASARANTGLKKTESAASSGPASSGSGQKPKSLAEGGAPAARTQFVPAQDRGTSLNQDQQARLQETTQGPQAAQAREQAKNLELAAFRAPKMLFKTEATAEREMGPLPANKAVSLTDRDSRIHLMRNASQINPVSKKAGNDGLICGGAAAASALVMSSKTPEACKANAKALEETCKHLGVKPTAAQQKAIDNLRKGEMSKTDVHHLQQVLYDAGRRAGIPEGGAADGMGPKQMFALAGHLKAAGAFPGSDVSFHQNATEIDGQKVLHWTTSVDDLHTNSVHPSSKHQHLSLVVGGAPPSDLTSKSRRTTDNNGQPAHQWGAEIRIGDKEVTADFLTGDKPNSYVTLRANVDELRNAPQTMEFKDGQAGPPSRSMMLYNWDKRIDRKPDGDLLYRPTG